MEVQPDHIPKNYISLTSASMSLFVSRALLIREFKKSGLPYFNMAGHVIVEKSDLQSFLDSRYDLAKSGGSHVIE